MSGKLGEAAATLSAPGYLSALPYGHDSPCGLACDATMFTPGHANSFTYRGFRVKYASSLVGFGQGADDAIGERLDELIEKTGEHLDDDTLLAEGRKERSPLNVLLTKDNNKAIDKCHLHELKRFVKQLRVAKNGKPTKTRAFVYVNHPDHDGKRVLLNIQSVKARPELRAQLLERAVSSLQRWLAYYGPQIGRRKSLARDVAKLRAKVERELFAGVR